MIRAVSPSPPFPPPILPEIPCVRGLKRLRETGRRYGQEREDRDLLAYLLWERGAFMNEKIGG